jgi:hypothetical protein
MNYTVIAYLKNCATYRFPARSLENAREIAYRIITEGLWVIHDDGTEEYYPITEIQKAKVTP